MDMFGLMVDCWGAHAGMTSIQASATRCSPGTTGADGRLVGNPSTVVAERAMWGDLGIELPAAQVGDQLVERLGLLAVAIVHREASRYTPPDTPRAAG